MNGLATRTTIREILAAYAELVDEIHDSFARLRQATAGLNRALGTCSEEERFTRSGSIHPVRLYGVSGEDWRPADWTLADRVIAKLQRDTWEILVLRLEVRRVMSVERAKELDTWLEKGVLPPLTEEAVWGWARPILEGIDGFYQDAIREVFELLRPRGHTGEGKLKTSSELEVPPRVILRGFLDFNPSYMDAPRADYRAGAQLGAIEKVLDGLEGRGMVQKSHNPELYDALNRAPTGETRHFEYRACRNGRLHLRFKNLDTLAKLNRAAGGARLRPGS